MMRGTVKLKLTCRMCGHIFTKKPLLMLFHKYKDLKEYPINIIQKYNFANFKIFENDGLPQQICEKCIEEFKSINLFIESCLNNQNKLRTEFPQLKLLTNKNVTTDDENDNDDRSENNLKKKSKRSLLRNNVLEELQIKIQPIREENVNTDPIKTEFFDLSLVKIENDEFNSNEVSKDVDSNYNEIEYNIEIYGDNDMKSEEYFNDNFQEDFTINCQFCPKIFDNIDALETHETERHKMKLYNKYVICEQCGESIKTYRFLEHIKLVHEGTKLYYCDDCGKEFKKFRAFKEHSIKYHQSDQVQINYDDKTKYPCTECNRVYLSLGILRNHIKRVHSDNTGSSNTISSKKPNEQSVPTTFQCDICNIKFRNIVSMEKHRANHSNEKYAHTFECPECERRFGRRDHLKYHIKLEHLKEKPFKCDQCNKSYVIGFQLNTHKKLVHSNDKNSRRARCENCNKTFHNSRYLLRHQKEVHSFDAQFVCVICNEKFFKQVHLIKHSQIHNSEKLKNPISNDIHPFVEEEVVIDNSTKEVVEYVVAQNTFKINRNINNEIQMAVSTLMPNCDEVDIYNEIIVNK